MIRRQERSDSLRHAARVGPRNLLAKMDDRMTKMDARIERGFENTDRKFAALADDVADIRRDMATKDQLFALETQVRGMQHTKLQSRVADLEEEVFGKARA